MLRDRAFCSHICGRLVSNGRAAPAPPGLCFVALAIAGHEPPRTSKRSRSSASGTNALAATQSRPPTDSTRSRC